jgi:hypothetical protein
MYLSFTFPSSYVCANILKTVDTEGFTCLNTLARDVAKFGRPNVTSMALALLGARAENPNTVPRIVPGRTLEEE